MAHPANPPGESKQEPTHPRKAKPADLPVAGPSGPTAAPPTREEFELLAARVRRLAAQINHGRA